MLVKRSYKNQVAIPKAILERAGLGPEDVYFDVECEKGRIILIPMQLEEKIPVEAFKRFEAKNAKIDPRDKVFSSTKDAIKHLHSKRR